MGSFPQTYYCPVSIAISPGVGSLVPHHVTKCRANNVRGCTATKQVDRLQLG